MKAIIPAAGYATRLYPLTLNTPKSLLKVGGRPIIEHIIDKLSVIKDVSTVYVVTNHKFYGNFAEWQQGYDSKIPIEVLNDHTTSNENRLGCIGDISYTIEQKGIDEDMIQINGDSIFEDELGAIYGFYKEKKAPVVMLIDVKDKEIAKRFGVVEIDENKVVKYFKEKPEVAPTTLCSVATYIYPRETVKMFKVYLDEGNNSDQPGRFVEWLYKRQPVYGFVYGGKYYDIGSKDTLEKARGVFGD